MERPISDSKEDIIAFLIWCSQNNAIATWNAWIREDREKEVYRVDLEGAYLRAADLTGADLQVAYLTGANLRGANLQGAYLIGADLRGANLEGAYLRGAYLIEANLIDADLRGANLEGAYLIDADLTGANVEGTILERREGSGTASELKAEIESLNKKLKEQKNLSDKDKEALKKQLEQKEKELKDRDQKEKNIKNAVIQLKDLEVSDEYIKKVGKARDKNFWYGFVCFVLALVVPLAVICFVVYCFFVGFDKISGLVYFLLLLPFTAFGTIGYHFMQRSKRYADTYHRLTKYQRDIEKLGSILLAADKVESSIADLDTLLDDTLKQMAENAISELTQPTQENKTKEPQELGKERQGLVGTITKPVAETLRQIGKAGSNTDKPAS